MLKAKLERQFKKDYKRAIKRGKNINKLKVIMLTLREEIKLPIKYRNHKLKGNYGEYWECHIEPDWLLVYKKTSTEIIFCTTGSHSDLFK